MARGKSNNRGIGFKDETGNIYGKLTVLEYIKTDKPGAYWKCQCECGNVTVIRGGAMRDKKVGQRSCRKCSNIRHGLSRTREHSVWRRINQRCHNPNSKDYRYYGGKGIHMCERWRTFENFLADMGPKPFPKATVERIDGNIGYGPDNCRWASQAEQTLNKSNSVMLTHNGRTQNFMLWCRELGIHPATLENRLHRSGWSVEKALSTPVKKNISTHPS